MNKLKTNTKWDGIIQQIDDFRYLIPRAYKPGMHVDAKLISSPELMQSVCHDLSIEQAANVAMLPGILTNSLAMPDMHQGYGFPIGGVAAMDARHGVVSPGGVGFDINCGVRLLITSLRADEIKSHLEDLVFELYKSVPAGTGSAGPVKLSEKDLDDILENGSSWAEKNGFANQRDLDHTEEFGRMPNAHANTISERAKKRGISQLATLGSGNHFLELQRVQQIFDPEIAQIFGLFADQVCLMIHCGSRGLGHQVCTDFLARSKSIMSKYQINLPDRELACMPINSDEGKEYLSAMSCAANFAFANRQCISHFAAEVIRKQFGQDTEVSLLYDVAHNMAKFEEHKVDGQTIKVLVHRKGATRAFPAGHADLVPTFQKSGQPVIIPGDMGRASYVLVGTQMALTESFGSVCHGAGRLMSRTQARKGRNAKDVIEDLKRQGVIAKATSREGLTEEVPDAYKPIDQVIDSVQGAGLAERVARLKPIGVIKG